MGTGLRTWPLAPTSLLVIRCFWHVLGVDMLLKGNKKKRKDNLIINHHQPVNVDVTSDITYHTPPGQKL